MVFIFKYTETYVLPHEHITHIHHTEIYDIYIYIFLLNSIGWP